MTRHTLRLATGPGSALAASFATLRAELDLPGEFPAAVVAEAGTAAPRAASRAMEAAAVTKVFMAWVPLLSG